ncbi:hypothetical protein V6N12_045413 [Hibiscus sabdariffa]|uniref:RNase H type-1 domain-containing protein n=1 Tax=Hibiscus sabdariffa TaxID=183260 RepID=A0ABR2G2Q2_9ROSI
MGSVGGVIHGPTGEWIIGYTKQIGHVSPLQAELWSILVGLEVAWSMGVEQLQVQTDCKQASTLVLSDSQSSSIPIVRAIRSLPGTLTYFGFHGSATWSPMLCRRLLPYSRTRSYFMNLLLQPFNLCLSVMLMDLSILDMSSHNP